VISLSRTSVTLECPLSGASEKAKISVLALLRNNSQFGTNGSGKVLALPLYAKYLTIIRNVFFANYIFAIFLLYLLRQLTRSKYGYEANVASNIILSLMSILFHNRVIPYFNQVETNFKSFLHVYVGNNNVLKSLYTRSR